MSRPLEQIPTEPLGDYPQERVVLPALEGGGSTEVDMVSGAGRFGLVRGSMVQETWTRGQVERTSGKAGEVEPDVQLGVVNPTDSFLNSECEPWQDLSQPAIRYDKRGDR